MAENIVVAWDVDGTLVERASSGAPRVHERAVRSLGLQPRLPQGSSEGMTDRQVIEALVPSEISGRQDLIRRAVELIDELTEESITDYPVSPLPGVDEVLLALQDADAQRVLLTGNTRKRARVKLACAGLARHFDWEKSAFGSQCTDRFDLIASWQKTHGSRPGTRMVVVGDTPLDIAAARASGVEVASAATGMYSASELAALSPDYLIEDWIVESDQFLAWILGR